MTNRQPTEDIGRKAAGDAGSASVSQAIYRVGGFATDSCSLAGDSEVFIDLGEQQDTFFFTHVISNPGAYSPDIAVQTYNAMISNGMIRRNTKNVVVFDLVGDGAATKIRPVVTQHATKPEAITFDEANLIKMYPRAMNAYLTSKEPTFVISYDYRTKLYRSFMMATDKSELPDQPLSNAPAVEAVYYLSTKPL